MFVGSVKDMPKIDMTPGGAVGAVKQVAVGPEQGWEDYVMRIITLEQGGHSPRHAHDWPHINYIIAGTGVVEIDGDAHPVEKGVCAYIPSGADHCFTNTGEAPLEFICIVPTCGDK